MKISFVVAVAANGVIGKDNALPWRLSDDLKFFKRVTMGKPVIMGRTTYDSIGKPLPGRTNIVITRNADYRASGVRVVHSIEAALELGKQIASNDGQQEVTVIGGAQIFGAMLTAGLVDRMYYTEVHGSPDGDTFFPPFDRRQWSEVARENFPANDSNTYACSILTLDRTLA
jgi:dihydrofolate reductase